MKYLIKEHKEFCKIIRNKQKEPDEFNFVKKRGWAIISNFEKNKDFSFFREKTGFFNKEGKYISEVNYKLKIDQNIIEELSFSDLMSAFDKWLF